MAQGSLDGGAGQQFEEAYAQNYRDMEEQYDLDETSKLILF